MKEIHHNKFNKIIPLEVFEEADALRILILDTDSSIIAFALYNKAMERELVVNFLQESLPIPVIEFTLSSRQKNPLNFLESWSQEKRTCVLFYNLEEALPEVAGYVNIQRETFAEFSHAVVFWVSEYGLREIANKAPDFWAWRSGVFDFRFAEKAPVAAMKSLGVIPFVFRDRQDLERRLNLYQELFKEHSRQEKPDDKFLSGLNYKQSLAYYFLGRLPEAEAQAREALTRSQRIGAKAIEAAALLVLSLLASDWGHLEKAEELAQQALVIVESSGPGQDEAIGAIFHQLSNIALQRQQLDSAESWCRKSLEISERLGVDEDLASSYHRLGRIVEERGQIEAAEQWYRKAIEIYERLGLEKDVAGSYHQLGLISEKRRALETAEQWYRKAIEIYERLGLDRDVPGSYHQMGRIAEERGQLEIAEQWYRKALEISKRLGLEKLAGPDYFHLGTIAQKRKQFNIAEEYYFKALKIAEDFWHIRFTVNPLKQLGLLYLDQNQVEMAIKFLSTALPLAIEFNMQPETIFFPLAFILNTIGENRFRTIWEQVAEGQKPPMDTLYEIIRILYKGNNKEKAKHLA